MKKTKKLVALLASAITSITMTTALLPLYNVKADTQPSVKYTTHVQKVGWQQWFSDGDTAGTSGEGLRLEAIKINIAKDSNLGVEYSTHVQKVGWQDWTSNGNMAGTENRGLRLEAIKIKLKGEDADKYDIYYRVHAQTYGWLDWAKNGQEAGTCGLSKRLEAIQIKVVKKGSAAPGSTTRPCVYKPTSVTYSTHVQSYGWQKPVSDGKTSGTVGQSKRLEAIKIGVSSGQYSGGISYATHVQKIGWQKEVSNNAMSGTSGKALRLEAIKMHLTGDLADNFDVYYRVQCQKIGWMGWAKNGEAAGTSGYGYRLEAIEIKLVEKGGNAPGSTKNSFLEKTSSQNTGNKDDSTGNTGSNIKPETKPSDDTSSTDKDIQKHDNYSYIKNNKIYFNGIPKNYGLKYDKEYTYRSDIAQEIVNEINVFRKSIGLNDVAVDNTMCVPIANCLANCRYQYDDKEYMGGCIGFMSYISDANLTADDGEKLGEDDYDDNDSYIRKILGFRQYNDFYDDKGNHIDDGACPCVLTVKCNIPVSEYSAHELLYNKKYGIGITSQTHTVLSSYNQRYINKVGVSVVQGTDGVYWVSIVYYSDDMGNACTYMDEYFY